MQENSRYRVFIVDDHPVVRDGLKNLIEQEEDLVVCGEAADGAQAVDDQVGTLLAAYRHLADLLSLSPVTDAHEDVSPSALREAELGCLRRWQSDATVGRGAMAVVMAGEWVQNLARLETDLESAVSTAAEAARKPWWR